MGLFGSSIYKENRYWVFPGTKTNCYEDGYLRSEGLINTSRIPIKHIDTVIILLKE